MSNIPLVYISGPYRDKDKKKILANITLAESVAKRLELAGYAFLCPHANSSLQTQDKFYAADRDGDFWITADCKMLAACDAILMIGDWEKSEGASKEMGYANFLGMPVFTDIEKLLETKATEFFTYPCQSQMFRELQAKSYFLMMRKSSDYSASNVLATGAVGLCTRIWDKISRLLNLQGFNIMAGTYSAPKVAANESIDDTLSDLANYAVIFQIYRDGKWGR